MRRSKEFVMLIFLMTILSVFTALVWITSFGKYFAPLGVVDPNVYNRE